MDKKFIYVGISLIFALFLIGACNNEAIGALPKDVRGTYYFELVDNQLGLEGYTREAYGKQVTLIDVGSSGNVIVEVSGVQEVINSGTTKTVNGIKITNKWTFYTDNKFRRAAELQY